MKRSLKLLALAFLVLLFTGCKMKADYQIEVKKDKNVALQFVVAYDDEMIDSLISMKDSTNANASTTHTEQERWDYLESSANESSDYKDFKKEKYDKDGFKGYTYTLDL